MTKPITAQDITNSIFQQCRQKWYQPKQQLLQGLDIQPPYRKGDGLTGKPREYQTSLYKSRNIPSYKISENESRSEDSYDEDDQGETLTVEDNIKVIS